MFLFQSWVGRWEDTKRVQSDYMAFIMSKGFKLHLQCSFKHHLPLTRSASFVWVIFCAELFPVHLLPHATHTFHRSQDKEVTHAYERTWGQGGVDLFFFRCALYSKRSLKKKKHRIIANRYKQATQRIICSLSKEDGLFVQVLNTGSLALASPDMFFVVDYLFWFYAKLLYMYMMYTVCGCSYLVGDAASCFKDPPVLHGFEFGTLQSLERAFKCFKHDSTAPLK